MTTEGRREGFVAMVNPKHLHPQIHEEGPNCKHEECYPAWVLRLDPGEPKPGETWQWGEHLVEIVAPMSIDPEGYIVEWWVRPKACRDALREASAKDLTRAPATRDVTFVLTGGDCPSDTAWMSIGRNTLRVPASMSDDEVMAAIRGAVEVGDDG